MRIGAVLRGFGAGAMASAMLMGSVAGCDAPSDREPLGDGEIDVAEDDEAEAEAEDEAEAEADETPEDDADDAEDAADEVFEAWLVPPRSAPELEGACEVPEDSVQCHVDNVDGVQYCDGGEWGPCLTETVCDPGDIFETECFGQNTELDCFLEMGIPTYDCGFTPLVLSFDGVEPEFAAAAASFELSAGDGACLAREMPTADTPWLALDLDGSGAIENGRELFGSASPMPDGKRAHDGFEALREYDANADGRITSADPVWSSLLLWSDFDADRQSTAAELVPLAHSGVDSIELDHVDERRCDDRGNCGIERASFGFGAAAGTTRRGTVIDVHIPCD